jgi:hypothetical protein
MTNRRPTISEETIKQIKTQIRDHPDWGRSRLSRELCKMWDWRSEAGQLKDISCRDMLRTLDAKGDIALPPAKFTSHKVGVKPLIQLKFHDTVAVDGELKAIMPLSVELASTISQIADFKSYIEQYHYLGYGQSVGECMRYIVRTNQDIIVACLLFGSSAWRCASRDKHIGWSDSARTSKLHYVTNNTRFLILPWVKVPHMASHILSLISRHVSADWQIKYGHPIYMLETFVERERFAGICYKAANWIRVGETTGRGRDSVTKKAVLPIKDVYIYPLSRNYRKKLSENS